MWIKELHIKNFGRFSDKRIQLSPGMNLIYGENESGKSTMHTFIRGCLYGMRKMRGRASKKDEYTHYQPWDNSNYYAGNLRFVCGDKVFRLERDFTSGMGGGLLVCETDGELLSLENGDLDMLLGGVGEAAFLNTVSIGQLRNETDDGLIGELQNYIANFQESGDHTIDMDQTLQILKRQKKSLDKQFQNEKEKHENRIRQLTDYIGYLNDEMDADQDRLQNIEGEILFTKRVLQNMEYQLETLHEEKAVPFDEDEDELGFEDEPSWRAGDGFLGIPRSIWITEAVVLAVMFCFCIIMGNYESVRNLLIAMMLISIVMIGGCGLVNYWGMTEPANSDGEESDDPDDADAPDALVSFGSVEGQGKNIQEEYKEARTALKKLYWQKEHFTAELEEKQTLIENCQQDIQMYTEENMGAYARLQKENKAAIELAVNRMQEAMVQMQGSTGSFLKRRTSEIFSEITNGFYTQVQIEDHMCTGVHTMDRYVPIEQLSRGTIWQVYFAYRMAAGELLADEEPLPILLDDAFVMYDEIRLVQVLDWLSRLDKQVMIFTCQKREKELLDQLGAEYCEIVL